MDTHSPALRELQDVIVFSVQGTRSLASLLSGGDYDGDKVRNFSRKVIDALP